MHNGGEFFIDFCFCPSSSPVPSIRRVEVSDMRMTNLERYGENFPKVINVNSLSGIENLLSSRGSV